MFLCLLRTESRTHQKASWREEGRRQNKSACYYIRKHQYLLYRQGKGGDRIQVIPITGGNNNNSRSCRKCYDFMESKTFATGDVLRYSTVCMYIFQVLIRRFVYFLHLHRGGRRGAGSIASAGINNGFRRSSSIGVASTAVNTIWR